MSYLGESSSYAEQITFVHREHLLCVLDSVMKKVERSRWMVGGGGADG